MQASSCEHLQTGMQLRLWRSYACVQFWADIGPVVAGRQATACRLAPTTDTACVGGTRRPGLPACMLLSLACLERGVHPVKLDLHVGLAVITPAAGSCGSPIRRPLRLQAWLESLPKPAVQVAQHSSSKAKLASTALLIVAASTPCPSQGWARSQAGRGQAAGPAAAAAPQLTMG